MASSTCERRCRRKLDADDGLRRALSAYVDTTTTSPDAWGDILDRAGTRRSRRRIGFSVGALTAAVAMIAAGVVVVTRPDNKPVNVQLVGAIEATRALSPPRR